MEHRSLAWLLQPLTVETFLEEIWGATHYHVSRNCPGYFDGLLDGSASVDELLGLFRPDLSLVRLVREDAKKDAYVYRLAGGGFDAAAIGKDFADACPAGCHADQDSCTACEPYGKSPGQGTRIDDCTRYRGVRGWPGGGTSFIPDCGISDCGIASNAQLLTGKSAQRSSKLS